MTLAGDLLECYEEALQWAEAVLHAREICRPQCSCRVR
jgi:hypothetical protein